MSNSLPPELELGEILATAEKAARKAGEAITAAREGGSVQINFKGELDLVTSSDLLAEKIIIEEISRRFPDHQFLSEEFKEEAQRAVSFDGPLWILDPIDGTTNYAHGHPQVGVSIGFMYQRQIRAGVVHAPFMGETFTAIRGGGAKLNGKPIKVSGTTELKKALVATGFPYRRDSLDQIIGRVRAVLENCRDVRRIGAGSLDICWVACGRLDAFYETLSAWDIAAATLIAREAGANVGNMVDYDNSGSAFPPDLFGEWLVTANPVLYPKIFELLQPIK